MKKNYGKKIVTLLLVIVLAMTVACGKSNDSEESTKVQNNSTQAVADNNAGKETTAQETKEEAKETVVDSQSGETEKEGQTGTEGTEAGSSASGETVSQGMGATSAQKETTTTKPQSTTAASSSGSGSGAGGSSASSSANGYGGVATDKEVQMAKAIVDSIIKPGMSQFEKAITINDWITSNVDYDYTYTYRTVEQTLTYKKCVCEGYARTYYTMAKLAGLEVVYVSGTANNNTGKGYEGHAWNQVKIDGVWYNTDSTWNDAGSGGINYDYFLISDSTLSKNHKWDKNSYKTCATDYDAKKMYEYGVASGLYGDAVISASVSEAQSKIDEYVKSGSSGVKWFYTGAVQNISNDFYNSLKKYDIPVYARGVYDTVNGITRIDIEIIQPSELANIPLVTNETEFNDLYNKMVAQGAKEYMLRYETTDGDISYWSDGWPNDKVSMSTYWYKDSKCMIFYIYP